MEGHAYSFVTIFCYGIRRVIFICEAIVDALTIYNLTGFCIKMHLLK